MRIALSTALAGALLVASHPVAAATTSFDLDTAPGMYSEWKASDVTENEVSFTATYRTVRKDKKWAPSYTLELSGDADTSVLFKGVFDEGDEKPQARATLLQGKKEFELGNSPLVLVLGQPRNVVVGWNHGVVRLTVDGATTEFKVDFEPRAVRIVASTGELEVRDIRFRTASGP